MRLRDSVVAVLAATLLTACASPSPPPPPAPAPQEQPAVPQTAQPGRIIASVKASVPPAPEQPWIKSVAFATPERGWLLLDRETLATSDGGKTWRPVTLPEPFDSLSFATPQLGHATLQDRLFRTTDGGETWVPVDTTGWPNPTAVFIDERHGWSIRYQPDPFYRTQDGGATWEKLPDPCPDQSRRPFSFISPSTGWLLCGFDEGSGFMSKRLYRTGDGGLTWTLLGEALVSRKGRPEQEWPGGLGIGDYVGGIFFLDERHGWYTGTRYGSFMRTVDGGRTWERAPGPALVSSQVQFITPQVGYRLGGGILTMTRDSGQTWTQVYPRRRPRELFYLDNRTYIGELDGALYRSDDAGQSWRLLSQLPAPLLSLSYSNGANAWALMGNEKGLDLYRSTDGGATWQHAAPVEERFQQVQALDNQTAILWDNANRLLITRDGGASFEAIAAPYDETGGHGFFFTSPTAGWFSRGFRLHTTADGGKTWQTIPLPANWKAQGVTVGPEGRVWASIVDVSDEYTPVILTLASADGGKTWTRYDLGDFNQPWPVYRCGLFSICVDSGGDNYSIVSHDAGQTWQYFQR